MNGIDSVGRTCIETTYYSGEHRTLWVVRLEGEILKVGETHEDPSGSRAHGEASRWASSNAPGVTFVWKRWRGFVSA